MATESFHKILQTIQSSGLNFKMEISPFSATIVLKNSQLKDKNGNPLILPPQNSHQLGHEDQTHQLVQQETVIRTLQAKLEDALNNYEQIYETKVNLENILDNLHNKLEASEKPNPTSQSNNSPIRNTFPTHQENSNSLTKIVKIICQPQSSWAVP